MNAEGEDVPSKRGFVRWLSTKLGQPDKEMFSPIKSDTWSIQVPADAVLQVVGATWSDDLTTQNATIQAEHIRASELDGRKLTAMLSYGVVLHVVDSVSGQELQGCRMVFAHGGMEGTRELRLPPTSLLHELGSPKQSPIALADRPGIRTGWVIAPDHAWARFAYQGASGELTVALSAEAMLDLEVRNLPTSGPTIQLMMFPLSESGAITSHTAPLLARDVDPSGFMHVGGLPAGPVRVALAQSQNVPVFGPFQGMEDATLVAGTSTAIEIDAGALQPHLGTLDARIECEEKLPKMAMTQMLSAVLEPLGDDHAAVLQAELASSEEHHYHCQFKNVVPGQYLFSIPSIGAAQSVELSGSQTTTLTMKLPITVPVHITVFLEESQIPITSADVRFRAVLARTVGAWNDVIASPESRSYSFRCVPGKITLLCLFGSREMVLKDIQIPSTEDPIVVRMSKGNSIPILVKSLQGKNDVLLPEPFWRAIRIESVDGTGNHVSTEIDATQIGGLTACDASKTRYYVDHPGRYRIVFPAWSGIAPVSPREVDVAKDRNTEVTFEARLQ